MQNSPFLLLLYYRRKDFCNEKIVKVVKTFCNICTLFDCVVVRTFSTKKFWFRFQTNELRKKEVAFVKMLWMNHFVEGATWEIEANMNMLAFQLSHRTHLFNEEVPVQILDRQVKKSRNKEVAFMRVLWQNHLDEGATWRSRPI